MKGFFDDGFLVFGVVEMVVGLMDVFKFVLGKWGLF